MVSIGEILKKVNFWNMPYSDIVEAKNVWIEMVEIISKGNQLGVSYKNTHSCYDPSDKGLACGECDACILRKKGFNMSNIPDPTIYQ